ncbi:unnamed protein product [Orchesella dallaii]|uniref:Uncharacterized protein n=1 Tax=Orchesella dallaii TaxID=48710 RepID=A0ABP1PKC2_9HEXA
MFRSSRKVKPQGQYNDLSSSSDSEGISSLAYVLRGSKKSKISRIFDNKEIEFIEKRFNDTARVIFQVGAPSIKQTFITLSAPHVYSHIRYCNLHPHNIT